MQVSDIHPRKAVFLNNEAVRVASLLRRLDEVLTDKKNGPAVGSVAHLDAIQLGQITEPIIFKSYDTISKGKVIAIKSCLGTKCIGYDTSTYVEFLKLLTATNKEKIISNSVSEEAVAKAAFTWVTSYYSDEATTDYVTYLCDFIEKRTDSYRVYFPITNLHIDNFFRIGNAEFIYFTEDYIQKIVEGTTYENPNIPDPSTVYKEFIKYKGHVFVTCIVKAEQDKAIESAFKQCSLALDVLKTCSSVTGMPNETAKFDIDKRVKFAQKSEVFLTKSYNFSEFSITTTTAQFPYKIDSIEWNKMLELGLKVFSDFLLQTENNTNELKSLILGSLSRYSNTLSQTDKHQRVVELYTILESLLLKDENSSIIESVAKYLAMLIAADKSTRYECANHVRAMYKVRSGLIHHAKRLEFNDEDLKKLQVYVLTLMHNMILKSYTHNEKRSVLNEIDDILMSA